MMINSISTYQGHSGPGSNGNEGVLCIPQSSSITKASLSDCLVLYPGHTFEVGYSYASAEMQSVYSAVPADFATDVLEIKGYLLSLSLQWKTTS